MAESETTGETSGDQNFETQGPGDTRSKIRESLQGVEGREAMEALLDVFSQQLSTFQGDYFELPVARLNSIKGELEKKWRELHYRNFKEWKARQVTSSVESTESASQVSPVSLPEENAATIREESDSDTVSNELPIEVINKENEEKERIIKEALKNGVSRMNASTKTTGKFPGYGTFGELNAPFNLEHIGIDKEHLGELNKNGIFEVLSYEVFNTRKRRSVPNPNYSGSFKDKLNGTPAEIEETYRVPTTMDRIKQDGSQERALVFTYGAFAGRADNDDVRLAYRDYAGSLGIQFIAQIAVPVPVGQEIFVQIHKDLKFIRELIDRFVRAKYTPEFIEEWNQTVRPPYEIWDTEATGIELTHGNGEVEVLPLNR